MSESIINPVLGNDTFANMCAYVYIIMFKCNYKTSMFLYFLIIDYFSLFYINVFVKFKVLAWVNDALPICLPLCGINCPSY